MVSAVRRLSETRTLFPLETSFLNPSTMRFGELLMLISDIHVIRVISRANASRYNVRGPPKRDTDSLEPSLCMLDRSLRHHYIPRMKRPRSDVLRLGRVSRGNGQLRGPVQAPNTPVGHGEKDALPTY